MLLFLQIKKHYTRVSTALAVTPEMVRKTPMNHTVVVLVGRIHLGVLRALDYSKSLRPNHLVAVTVAADDAEVERMQAQWREFGLEIPLEIVYSPYRELTRPIKTYIEDLDNRWDNDTVTVVIPEFVVNHWYQHALHNQTALRLKGSLLFREGIVVTSVPYLVSGREAEAHSASVRERGIEVEGRVSTAYKPHQPAKPGEHDGAPKSKGH